jgi:D-amino-acid dehydrogenase
VKPLRVVVVGGGIAGLSVAYYLAQRDADVVVLDAAAAGSGASYANGGWITPAQAGPLPEPGLTIYGLRALLDTDSALYIKPSYLPTLAPWLLRFWTYCNERDFERGTAALAALGRRVFDLVDGMVADGVEFELYKMGMLCATRTEREARKVLDGLAPMRRLGFGVPDDLVVGDELHALEPALSPRVQAGFFVDEHWHVRSSTMTEALARSLRAKGATIAESAPVVGFDVDGDAVRAVRTRLREWPADAVVLAAGSWTTGLARQLGVRIPMQPGKGYTFMIRPKVMPRHGILFADIHAGATPLGDRLRIGGTMEFSGFGRAVDTRRISTIFRLASDYIELEQPEYEEPWAGLRPMVADGLPILDRAGRYSNAYLATGYSMLGMTLGPPAGEAMAEMVLTGERPAVFEPFKLGRFGPVFRRRRSS